VSRFQYRLRSLYEAMKFPFRGADFKYIVGIVHVATIYRPSAKATIFVTELLCWLLCRGRAQGTCTYETYVAP
jgi:hypothetical protein